MVHLVPLEIAPQRNGVASFVDHHGIIVIKGIVYKDRRTAQIGTDGGPTLAGGLRSDPRKVNAWHGIESQRNPFDR